MEPRDRFRLLAALALVDGHLDPAEQNVLLRSGDGMGLSRQECMGLLDEMRQGGRLERLAPPADPAERQALFEDLLRVANADGTVAPQELKTLRTLAPSFGVAPEQIPALLARAARGGVPSGRTVAGGAGSEASEEFELVDEGGQPSGAAAATRAIPGRKSRVQGGTATCPSCGAPVEFRNPSSVALICEYCDTTVVREDGGQVLESLGKVSHVREDASPLQVGAAGRFQGTEFVVLGRIQVEHSTGYWNEWYVEWADRRTGWLAEAQGQYYVTFPDEQGEQDRTLPPFERLQVGQRVSVQGKRFTVTEVGVARATGTEGETPVAAREGWELPYADLRRPDAGFATIDYSDDVPRTYVGRCVRWGELQMRHYRRFDGWR